MTKLPVLAGILVLSLRVEAQVTPALQCTVNAAVTPTVRSEGLTELVGDVVLKCGGGAPTPAGQPVPQANITMFLNTQVTSRLLSPFGISEAVLLVDDPAPGIQKACPAPLIGCPLVGTGGSNTYASANMFPGTLATGENPIPNSFSSNSVTFYGVPIDPPGTNGFRTFRITNVRANVPQLATSLAPSQAGFPFPVTGLVTVDPRILTLSNPNPIPVANVQPGFLAGVTPGTGQDCPGVSRIGGFSLNFQENFPTAFKTRVTATSTGPPGNAVQNIPGLIYNTESAFVPDASTGAPAGMGWANAGTRLLAHFNNIPSGVSLILPATNALINSSGASGGTFAPVGGNTQGSNVVFMPDASGNLDIPFEVTSRTNFTDALNTTIPITGSGAAATLPANIMASLTFPSVTTPLNSLFGPASPNAFVGPAFESVQPGITNPPASTPITVATFTACGPTTQSLGSAGSAAPVFLGLPSASTSPGPTGPSAPDRDAAQTFSGLLVPSTFHHSVVSPGTPVNNVTVAKDPAATWFNVTLNQSTTPVTATFTLNPSAIPQATSAQTLTSHVTFSSRDLPGGGSLSVPVTLKITPGPWFTKYGVQSAASYIAEVIAPGEMFLVSGDGFGPSPLAGPLLDSNGRASSIVGNTQVLFDGTPVPLYYSVGLNGKGYVTGFAPFGLDGKTQTSIQVVYNTSSATGGGQAAAFNQDLTPNGASNPEAIGNQVILYGTGAGQTTPGGRDGALTGIGGPVGKLKLPVKVFIDGIEATDLPYVGPAPSLVEGIFQINARIPKGVHSGNVPITVQVEDKLTQPGVTVAIK